MKIKLDQIETAQRIKALQLRDTFRAEYCEQLYFDTELRQYVVVFAADEGNRVSGKILLPEGSVRAAHVSEESVPKHQPIGTPESHDTPSGQKKKNTVDKAKSVIAQRIEERKSEGAKSGK